MTFVRSANQRATCLAAAILTGIVSTSTVADDIDVYKAGLAKQQKPNILFVLDYSGSMTWDTSGIFRSKGIGPSRISVLKEAMNEILDSNEDSIYAGLGPMFASDVSGIQWPISDLASDASTIDPDIAPNTLTVKDIMKRRINDRNAGGNTRTVDALVQAAQYFRGDPVTHNDSRATSVSRHKPPTWNPSTNRYEGGHVNASHASTYSPSDAWTASTSGTFYCNDYSGSGGPNFCEQKIVSNCKSVTDEDPATSGFELINNLWGDYNRCQYSRTATWETPRYNSPIGDSCEAQTNAIVMVTDGEPTRINRGPSLRSLVGNDLSVCEDLSNTIFAGSEETEAGQGNCGIEIVNALATKPVYPYLPNSHVKTYTIGFAINGYGQNYLKRLAQEGRGKFFNTENAEELKAALNAVVEDIKKGTENFTELAVDVDKASFSHSDRVYYSMFTPSKRSSWQGNLKGYFLGDSGLEDINGVAATNNNKLVDEAQSFWSSKPDGNRVDEGGASEQLLAGSRNLYTFVTGDVPATGITLANRSSTRLHRENTDITNDMLGLDNSNASDSQRDAALDWIQNAPMGDPLHTRSVGVTYADKQVVFIMTNQGLLHAFDASKPVGKSVGDTTGGDELFAFMPARLLKNLPALQINQLNRDHIYGLDGDITRWHDDTNNDGIVNNSETVMLYFGMRRGGNAYYAMNISDYSNPKLKWVIDETTPGFERLAQSWSRMSIIRVAERGTTRRVLAFGGGYDAKAQDDVNSPVASRGNAIYMVSEDGKLLWNVDDNDDRNMKYSIASDLTVIDSDGDQLADRLYVGDLGGQIWRVDFDDISQTPAVTRLADLADKYHQPFFYPPSVALNGRAGERFLSVTIGSGNRTSPLLGRVQNNFYMIKDTDVKKGAPSKSFSTVKTARLYDATDNLIQSTNVRKSGAARKALEKARGWRVRLAEGEKALSSVLTYEGKIMATTFVTSGQYGEDACGFESSGAFYVMDVNDASVKSTSLSDSQPLDGTDSGTGDSGEELRRLRSRPINTQGIPSAPVPVLARGSDKVQIFVDKEPVDEFDRKLSRVYWHAR